MEITSLHGCNPVDIKTLLCIEPQTHWIAYYDASQLLLIENPGGHLNIDMSSHQYMDSRVKDKTVSRPSYL